MKNNGFQVHRGHFYAVGAGPGAADLLTLRAVEVLKTSQVIICPRSASTRNSLALEIISDFVSDQEVIEHVYPMSRNENEIRESWTKAAILIAVHCLRGRTVSQVTLGDPHVYSTCAYVLPLLNERLGVDRIHVVPGITAFQACAARFIQPLATQEDRLMLMPGSDIEEVEKSLERCETLVLYKAGRNLGAVFALLKRHGLEQNARVVFNAEMSGKEQVYPDLEEALEHEPGYLACVIVHMRRRKWSTKS